MRNTDPALYDEYMLDGTHPTRKRYLEWWAPKMEQYPYNFLSA